MRKYNSKYTEPAPPYAFGTPRATSDGMMKFETSARMKLRHDRRSATRPRFLEGWRKTIPSDFYAMPSRQSVGRVNVWIASTAALLEARSCLQVLTERDWESLSRLQDPANRYSSIAAKVLLRLGLSHALNLGMPRSHWEFGKTENGKPIVTNATAANFSVSHVEEMVAVAVSSHVNVGIDIESVDQNVSDAVITSFCHAQEVCSVSGLPTSRRTREFVRLWTLKEAYSKLAGLGHGIDFKTIGFLVDPIELRCNGKRQDPALPAQFESFWLTANNTLLHAAIAFDYPMQNPISTEVQIISLIGPHRDGQWSTAPSIC
jgi:phosphopantetheinyl transferase